MATEGVAAMNPRLMRAVWESTRSSSVPTVGIQQQTLQVIPIGGLDCARRRQALSCLGTCPGHDSHSIAVQELLADPTMVDAVYLGIIERAQAKPLR